MGKKDKSAKKLKKAEQQTPVRKPDALKYASTPGKKNKEKLDKKPKTQNNGVTPTKPAVPVAESARPAKVHTPIIKPQTLVAVIPTKKAASTLNPPVKRKLSSASDSSSTVSTTSTYVTSSSDSSSSEEEKVDPKKVLPKKKQPKEVIGGSDANQHAKLDVEGLVKCWEVRFKELLDVIREDIRKSLEG